MNLIKWMIIVIISGLVPSCNWVLQSIYGIKMVNKFDYQKYEHFISTLKNEKIVFQDIIIDSAQTHHFIQSVQDSSIKKNTAQPIKMFFFKQDSLIFYTFNCEYPMKKRKLCWECSNYYDVFPPKKNEFYNFQWNLNQFQKFWNVQFQNPKEYTIFITWSFISEKNSKEFILFIHKYLLKNHLNSTQYNLILINHDDFYIKYK